MIHPQNSGQPLIIHPKSSLWKRQETRLFPISITLKFQFKYFFLVRKYMCLVSICKIAFNNTHRNKSFILKQNEFTFRLGHPTLSIFKVRHIGCKFKPNLKPIICSDYTLLLVTSLLLWLVLCFIYIPLLYNSLKTYFPCTEKQCDYFFFFNI